MKNALNVYMDIAADVYRSEDPALDDEQYEELMKTSKKISTDMQLDIAKKIAELLYDIESEIEKYYINRNGNKYHKLSEFYNWFTSETKLNINTKLNQEFPSNQSIESLINSIDL